MGGGKRGGGEGEGKKKKKRGIPYSKIFAEVNENVGGEGRGEKIPPKEKGKDNPLKKKKKKGQLSAHKLE